MKYCIIAVKSKAIEQDATYTQIYRTKTKVKNRDKI